MKKFKIISLALIFTVGCASSSKLDLDSIRSNESAGWMGKITVLDLDKKDVTSKCYANFTDEKFKRKSYRSIDKSGWVFADGKPGDTYIQMVMCTVGGFQKQNVRFESKEIQFPIKNKEIAYFGHITIQLDYTPPSTASLFLGGAIAGAMAGAGKTSKGSYEVQDKFPEATAELKNRFGSVGKIPVKNMCVKDETIDEN